MNKDLYKDIYLEKCERRYMYSKQKIGFYRIEGRNDYSAFEKEFISFFPNCLGLDFSNYTKVNLGFVRKRFGHLMVFLFLSAPSYSPLVSPFMRRPKLIFCICMLC